jgi:hypothetical protein
MHLQFHEDAKVYYNRELVMTTGRDPEGLLGVCVVWQPPLPPRQLLGTPH